MLRTDAAIPYISLSCGPRRNSRSVRSPPATSNDRSVAMGEECTTRGPERPDEYPDWDGLRRPTLLASGPTFGDLYRDVLGIAGTVGGAMAQRCRGPRPAGIAAAFADHGNRIKFGRASVGRRGRSVAPTWCRTAGALGPCRHDFYRGSVGIDPAIAAPIVCPVDHRGGGRCWNCPQLRDPWPSISPPNWRVGPTRR
jgi:hypothetical protein